MTDEHLVRGAWKCIRADRPIYSNSSEEVILVLAVGGDNFVDYSGEPPYCWSKAATFTRDRIEQIRLVREEMDWLESSLRRDNKRGIVKRLLQRLEAAEAELFKGMNREFVDEYMKGVK